MLDERLAVITLRLPTWQHKIVKEAAKKAKKTMNAFCRDAVLSECGKYFDQLSEQSESKTA